MFGQSPMKKIDKTIEKASKLINTCKYPDAYQLLLKLNGTYGVYLQNYRNDEVDFMFKVCLYEIYHNIEDPRVKKAKETKPKTQEELATEYYLKGSKYEALHNDAEAIECYKKAANLGSLEAMYQVGYLFLESENIVKDEQAGFYWVKKAADNGFDGAYGTLALLYLKGRGVEKDLDPAKEWMEKAAQNGDTHNVLRLADYYYTHNDDNTACYWYKKAAENGDAESMYKCAALLMHKNGSKSTELHYIVRYFRNSAKKGYENAQTVLPSIEKTYKEYLNSLSDEKLNEKAVAFENSGDKDIALELYTIAAERGDKRALYNAGKIYMSNDKNLQNYQKGFEIMLKLANENYREPQEWLNKIYQGGYGIDADSDAAKVWLSKSFDSPSIFEQ